MEHPVVSRNPPLGLVARLSRRVGVGRVRMNYPKTIHLSPWVKAEICPNGSVLVDEHTTAGEASVRLSKREMEILVDVWLSEPLNCKALLELILERGE